MPQIINMKETTAHAFLKGGLVKYFSVCSFIFYFIYTLINWEIWNKFQ